MKSKELSVDFRDRIVLRHRSGEGVQPIQWTSDCKDPNFDGIILITQSYEQLPDELECLKAPLQDYSALDCCFGEEVVVVKAPGLPGNRLLFASTGPVNRDYDDIRRVQPIQWTSDCKDPNVQPIQWTSDCKDPNFDGIILITQSYEQLPDELECLKAPLQDYSALDCCFVEEVVVVKAPGLPGNRLLFASTGPVNRDYDDIRRVQPIQWTSDCKDPNFDGIILITQSYEQLPDELECLKAPLQDYSALDCCFGEEVVVVKAPGLPGNRLLFASTGPVNRDYDDIRRFSDAAANGIKRALKTGVQRPLLVCPQHNSYAKNTLAAVLGALQILYMGITYDTGGADIKAGGVMAGMHRDKCGSAAVAGFFQILAKLKPKHLKVVGAMAMVRNSVGSGKPFNDIFALHGVDSDKPLPYSHIDIAGSSGPFPGVPTGAPILAMAAKYLQL
ncbi:unnamed protein product [Leuciscus chuanchicus]